MATTSSEHGLREVWSHRVATSRAALIPYVTAGYPDDAACLEMIAGADELADIIEIGVPFSDPLADGPTIQRSTFDALARGMTLARTLDLIDRARPAHPVIVFSYLNPILQYGLDRFLAAARELGVAGLLLTDLPAGADPAVEDAVAASSLALIRLIAPTTAPDRLSRIVAGAEGFLYLITRLGVTGASPTLASDLAGAVNRVRAVSSLPVAVGFGIATAEQAAEADRIADGVVVGSALVEALRTGGPAAGRRLLAAMRTAMNAAAA